MYFVHISKGGKYMNTKILLITNKGYSPIFNNAKQCVWFLYNTKCTTPLPISYTKGIPVYVVPLDENECKLFKQLCYTSSSQS